jgi:hypothetical protein
MARPLRRPVRFTVCLAHDEARMLRALAAADGDDQADVVRRDIRRAYASRFGTLPPEGTDVVSA